MGNKLDQIVKSVEDPQVSVIEREDGEHWSVLVPITNAISAIHSVPNEFELCSPKKYDFSEPDKLLSLMEDNNGQRTSLALKRGIFPFTPTREVFEVEGRKYLRFAFPNSLPPVFRTIIKDALSYEAAINPNLEKCNMFANFHLETLESHDNHAEEFHQDFENARDVSVYAVSGMPTTVGSTSEEVLGHTSESALNAGIPFFHLRPERMYHWTGFFRHATPKGRFEGEYRGRVRPFALVGFTSK